MAVVNYAQDGSNSSDQNRHPRYWPSPVAVPFDHTVTLATTDIDTATDFSLLFHFPDGASLDLASLNVVASDMDTHGTPTLVFDIGLSDSDGTLDTVLINDTTIGQGGGRDNTDSGIIDSNGLFISADGKYLTLDIVTVAATAAAGTVNVSGYYTVNLETTTASA